MWAGGEAPVEERSKDEIKRDREMIECAFEGEIDEVKRLLGEGESLLEFVYYVIVLCRRLFVFLLHIIEIDLHF